MAYAIMDVAQNSHAGLPMIDVVNQGEPELDFMKVMMENVLGSPCCHCGYQLTAAVSDGCSPYGSHMWATAGDQSQGILLRGPSIFDRVYDLFTIETRSFGSPGEVSFIASPTMSTTQPKRTETCLLIHGRVILLL